MKYTANYLCRAAQIVCSVLYKWHLRFYLSAHSDFELFSCVGYLHPKDYIKSVKTLFLNLGLNNLYHPQTKSLLSQLCLAYCRFVIYKAFIAQGSIQLSLLSFFLVLSIFSLSCDSQTTLIMEGIKIDDKHHLKSINGNIMNENC